MIPVWPLSIVTGPSLVAPLCGPKNALRPALVGHAYSWGHAAPALGPRVSPHTVTLGPASGLAASGLPWSTREPPHAASASATVARCIFPAGTPDILTLHGARER